MGVSLGLGYKCASVPWSSAPIQMSFPTKALLVGFIAALWKRLQSVLHCSWSQHLCAGEALLTHLLWAALPLQAVSSVLLPSTEKPPAPFPTYASGRERLIKWMHSHALFLPCWDRPQFLQLLLLWLAKTVKPDILWLWWWVWVFLLLVVYFSSNLFISLVCLIGAAVHRNP